VQVYVKLNYILASLFLTPDDAVLCCKAPVFIDRCCQRSRSRTDWGKV